jgi:hypothetical protein
MRAIRCHTSVRVSALKFKGTVLSQNDALDTTRIGGRAEKRPFSIGPYSSDVLSRTADVEPASIGDTTAIAPPSEFAERPVNKERRFSRKRIRIDLTHALNASDKLIPAQQRTEHRIDA